MYSLSIVLPAYNEEENVAAAVETVSEVSQGLVTEGQVSEYEIILVNDGSKDNTGQIARELETRIPHYHLVEHYPNRGYGGALKAGFEAATKDLIAFVPADNQFVFSEIDRFLESITEADIVGGYRHDRQDTFIRRFNAFGWNTLVRILFGYLTRDIDCGFKLFRREVIKEIELTGDGFEFCPEVTAKVRKKGHKIHEVPISYNPRSVHEGKKINWRDFFIHVYVLLKYRFTD